MDDRVDHEGWTVIKGPGSRNNVTFVISHHHLLVTDCMQF